MPSFSTPTTPVYEGCVIGGITSKRTGKTRWYLRIQGKLVANKSDYISLKLEYDESSASRQLAELKAKEKISEYFENLETTGASNKRLTSDRVIKAYLLDYKAKAEKNEQLETPLYFTTKNPMSMKRYLEEERVFRQYITPFFEALAERRDMASSFVKIKEIELDTFGEWVIENKGEMTGGAINKMITRIYDLYRFARAKEWVTSVPKIKRARENTRERASRNIKEEEFLTILETAKSIYKGYWMAYQSNPVDRDRNFHFWYRFKQFYWFINIMSFSGFRPWNGSTRETMLKWSDYKTTKEGTRYFERKEKGLAPYRAFVDPRVHKYLDNLVAMKEEYNIETDFMFFHLKGIGHHWGEFKAGDPIKNFRYEWEKTLKTCGLDSPVGTPRSQRLSIYSLRGYYITNQLRYGEISAFNLAKSVNSSTRMFDLTYYDYDVEAEAETLTTRKQRERDNAMRYKEITKDD